MCKMQKCDVKTTNTSLFNCTPRTCAYQTSFYSENRNVSVIFFTSHVLSVRILDQYVYVINGFISIRTSCRSCGNKSRVSRRDSVLTRFDSLSHVCAIFNTTREYTLSECVHALQKSTLILMDRDRFAWETCCLAKNYIRHGQSPLCAR